MHGRDEINEYDLGLPVPIPPLEERKARIPAVVWEHLARFKAELGAIFGERLRELRLFGSYARCQWIDESDVDVLVLVDRLGDGERNRIIDLASDLSDRDVYLAPLILTVDELQELRDRELLLAQDLEHDGIVV